MTDILPHNGSAINRLMARSLARWGGVAVLRGLSQQPLAGVKTALAAVLRSDRELGSRIGVMENPLVPGL